MIDIKKIELIDIQNKLSDIDEEFQILELKKIIEIDYINIKENSALNWEYFQNKNMTLEGNGISEELVEKKYNELSDYEIIEIARKLNENKYTKYPRYDLDVSINDILKYTISVICNGSLFIFYAIKKMIELAYKPIKKSSTIYWKFIWLLIEAFIIFSIYIGFIQNSVNNILLCIKIILFLYILFIIGFLIFNIFFYRNKSRDIDQNYKDYTVGYYFIENYDEIIYRISKAHLLEMKNKFPDKYNRFILEIRDKMKNE